MNDKRYDVFLSYSSTDRNFVRAVAERLANEANLRVWFDEWSIPPGDPWQEALEDGLEHSASVVVFVGPQGIRPWQNEEMRSALESRTTDPSFRVVPAILPGAQQPDKLPRFLRRLQWVEFASTADGDAFWGLQCGIAGRPRGHSRSDSEPEITDLQKLPYRGLKPLRKALLRRETLLITKIGILGALIVLALFFWYQQEQQQKRRSELRAAVYSSESHPVILGEILYELVELDRRAGVHPHFPMAELHDVEIPEIDLRDADLQGARFGGANLRGANLQGANLRAAFLNKVNLIGADLTGADLTGAYLYTADLTGAQIDFDLSLTLGDESTKLPAGIKPPKVWQESYGDQLARIQELQKLASE